MGEPALALVERADRQPGPILCGQVRPVTPLVVEGETGPLPLFRGQRCQERGRGTRHPFGRLRHGQPVTVIHDLDYPPERARREKIAAR